MASMNIKNATAHRLATELSRLRGVSVTQAVADAVRHELEREKRRRRPVAATEARAPEPRRSVVGAGGPLGPEPFLELSDERLCAVTAAGDVVADVDDAGGLRRERQQRVERRDAVGVGRRHRQPAAHLVEPAGGDPADPLLQGPERRQEEVPSGARVMPAVGGVALAPDEAGAAVPGRRRRPEQRVESGAPIGPPAG